MISRNIPVVVSSSGWTSKFDITSASIASISASVRVDVTVAVISKVASNPVIESMLEGVFVVGEGTGCNVGRAVTNLAQKEDFINLKIP